LFSLYLFFGWQPFWIWRHLRDARPFRIHKRNAVRRVVYMYTIIEEQEETVAGPYQSISRVRNIWETFDLFRNGWKPFSVAHPFICHQPIGWCWCRRSVQF
jgi:hypothetical protein